jgi:hypothetical protein
MPSGLAPANAIPLALEPDGRKALTLSKHGDESDSQRSVASEGWGFFNDPPNVTAISRRVTTMTRPIECRHAPIADTSSELGLLSSSMY